MREAYVAELLGEDPLMTPNEIAVLFRVDPRTVVRWVAAGRLPGIKTLGGQVRVRESAVRALFAVEPIDQS